MVDTLEMWPMPVITKKTGLCAKTIYSRIQDGSFPQGFQMSPNRVAWRSDEVIAWMESLPRAGKLRAAA